MPAKHIETLGRMPGSAHSASGSEQGLAPAQLSHRVWHV